MSSPRRSKRATVNAEAIRRKGKRSLRPTGASPAERVKLRAERLKKEGLFSPISIPDDVHRDLKALAHRKSQKMGDVLSELSSKYIRI